MRRLAWFSPLPPVRSGISQYNRELLTGLCDHFAIDLFVDGPPRLFESPSPNAGLFAAHDFVWMHRRRPYDAVVYQIGNAPCHDYMWPYLVRYPGLAVLHDGAVHHARARLLLQQKRVADYREEFWFNHPDAHPDLAELGASGLLGSLTYFWPMLRTVIEASSGVVVHNAWLADEIRDRHPGAAVEVIEMGVPQASPRVGAREIIRQQHRIGRDTMLFVAFGKVTPEKRIREAIRALAASADTESAHLLLAGEPAAHYDAAADARALGIENRVTIAGYLGDAEIDDYLAAADVCLCLRWPSLRETSASWLRCLASGRATVITDLVHTVDVPALDPRSWAVIHAHAEGEDEAPCAISIDILDEEHSLKLAMGRLAADASLRGMLGRNGFGLWQRRFTLDRMTAAYREALDRLVDTGGAPVDHSALPPHLRADGTEHADALMRALGLPDETIARVWKSSAS